MATVTEALTLIKENSPQPKIENLELLDSTGLVLVQDIISPNEYPSCDNSLMDGFAVFWEDIKNVSQTKPIRLKIIGESLAGAPYNGKFEKGEAVQVSTGAMLPNGADTIIPIEDCRISENFVSILKANNIYQFVRSRGVDISKGETIAKQGTVLTAPLIGLIASVGFEKVTTYQKANVAVIATGNELVAFNKPAKKFQVRDSNRIMLSVAVQNSGGEITNSRRVKDNVENICQAIKTSEEGNQLIIVSGGSSVGAFDFSKQAVKQSGFNILIESVRQRPGKSFFFARKNETLLFGLPGQSQAAYLCFAHYIFPIIKKLSGKKFGWKKVWGRLSNDLINEKNLTQFKPIQLRRVEKDFPNIIDLKKKALKLTENNIFCDGYIVLNEGDYFKKDELVEVFLFPGKEIF